MGRDSYSLQPGRKQQQGRKTYTQTCTSSAFIYSILSRCPLSCDALNKQRMLQNHNNTLFFSFNLNTSSLFSTSLVALMTACHVNTYNKLIKFLLRGQKEKRQSLEAPKWKNHSIRCHSSPLRCRAVICPQMRCVEHSQTESQSFVL